MGCPISSLHLNEQPDTVQPLTHTACYVLEILAGTSHGAFPHNSSAPASTLQFLYCLMVIFLIACNLLSPEFWARCWPFEERAVVTVPETAVNEYHRA
jgi:hypothetical protein